MSTGIEVGQVWRDRYLSTNDQGGAWFVRVMKLNAKSVRVEPCAENGCFLAGLEHQYRQDIRHFESGRMELVPLHAQPEDD